MISPSTASIEETPGDMTASPVRIETATPLRDHASQSRGRRQSSRRGRISFAAWSLAVGVGWLVVLPWLSELPSQKANIEWLRQQRIDPSARYYTEVEAMEPILEWLNAELTGRAQAK